MVLLLNLFIGLYILLSAWMVYKAKTWNGRTQIFIISLMVLFIYFKALPSYLPKGDIQRTAVPAFSVGKGEIEDRSHKPVPSEVRNTEQAKQYKDGLEFLK